MNLISWNCRGMGAPRAVQEMTKMVMKINPHVLFLIETKKKSTKMEWLRARWLFDNCFAVDSVGRGRGLALLWMNEVRLEVKSFSVQHIDANIKDCNGANVWRFTGYYGNPEVSQRCRSWDLLRQLKNQSSLPWFCAGDFNEIVADNEKIGGLLRPTRQMERFRQVIYDCNFFEVPFSGPKFTWSRGRGLRVIFERLDRGLATDSFFKLFPLINEEHIPTVSSDHALLSFAFTNHQEQFRRQKRAFRFENMWVRHSGCRETIMNGWRSNVVVNLKGLADEVKHCGERLSKWNKDVFGNIRYKINRKEEELKKLLLAVKGIEEANNIDLCREEIAELSLREEVMWRQRSKNTWLKEGDRNTRYFHTIASSRKRNNRVLKLQDEFGRWHETQEKVGRVFMEYFCNIFQTSNPVNMNAIFHVIDTRVTLEMNQELDKEVTLDEIRSALFQMNPIKAPGPDGMNALFYQKHWDVIGQDIGKVVKDLFNNGEFSSREDLARINLTNLVLIPKKQAPTSAKDFRPISLCNVVYKIISKVLVNRLKILLPRIIDENQCAFVPGRMIFDNVIAAHETLHAMQKRKHGKVGSLAVKLDMSKAYDRIEWGYLQGIMETMGFSTKWIRLVMNCVTSVSYSLMVNGIQSGHFLPSRGLRQGDPLSPYLFLLCAEGFSKLLKCATHEGSIQGVAAASKGPKISHLFFADDSLLFCRARMEDCNKLMEILKCYEKASGQCVNSDKSGIWFSSNTRNEDKITAMNILNIHRPMNQDSYLGLPLIFGRSKRQVFRAIREKIEARTQSWGSKLLSYAGKGLLIQTVAQTIPLFVMSCFKLPKSFCHDVNMLIAGFWWGDKDSKRKIHWKNWDSLCCSKLDGGLGFKDLESFNLALLAKQWWRIMNNENSVSFKVLKGKYFPNTSPKKVLKSPCSSFLWNSLLEGRKVVEEGAYWRVGDGKLIEVWQDAWLNKEPDFKATHPLQTPTPLKVAALINEEVRTWKVEMVNDLFTKTDASIITSIQLSKRSNPDKQIWRDSSIGLLTVKSAYYYARRVLGKENSLIGQRKHLWRICWTAKTILRVKYFIWRLVNESIPIGSILQRRGLGADHSCAVCGQTGENMQHVFLGCNLSRAVWNLYVPEILTVWESLWEENEMWDKFLEWLQSKKLVETWMYVVWCLWNNRNHCFHRLSCRLPANIAHTAEGMKNEFRLLLDTFKNTNHRSIARWIPPAHDKVKLNVDAAFCLKEKVASLGMVVRNEFGAVCLCAVTKIDRVESPFHAELKAVAFGLEIAKEISSPSIHVESDSLMAIEEILKSHNSFCQWQCILSDISDMSGEYELCTFTHIKRSANMCAHNVAKLPCELGCYLVWRNTTPPSLCNLDFLLE